MAPNFDNIKWICFETLDRYFIPFSLAWSFHPRCRFRKKHQWIVASSHVSWTPPLPCLRGRHLSAFSRWSLFADTSASQPGSWSSDGLDTGCSVSGARSDDPTRIPPVHRQQRTVPLYLLLANQEYSGYYSLSKRFFNGYVICYCDSHHSINLIIKVTLQWLIYCSSIR